MAISITNEETHDNAKFGELIEQSVKNVNRKGGKIAGSVCFIFFHQIQQDCLKYLSCYHCKLV